MDLFQIGLDGLQRAEATLERAAKRIADMPLSVSDQPADVVDLSAEAVAVMVSKHAFEANLKLIETARDLSDSSLNLLG